LSIDFDPIPSCRGGEVSLMLSLDALWLWVASPPSETKEIIEAGDTTLAGIIISREVAERLVAQLREILDEYQIATKAQHATRPFYDAEGE